MSVLSEREIAVASRYCRHMRIADIAAELGIAKKTVTQHLYRARSRLGLRSTKALHQYRAPA